MKDIPYDLWRTIVSERADSSYSNDLARGSSIEEAVIVRRFVYLWEKCKKEGHSEIFIQPDRFCFPVGLSVYSFRKTMAAWQEAGVVLTMVKGAPPKKFYILVENVLAEYLSEMRERGISALQVIENDKLHSKGSRSPKSPANPRQSQFVENDNLICRKRQDV